MTRKHLTPAIVLAVTATVAALASVAPAQAATIPKPPAVCNPTGPVGGHPVMTSFARTPGSINVTHSAQHVTFTVHVKDTTHPVTGVYVYLSSPTVSTIQRSTDATLHRISGSGKNGTWRGTATIPLWTNSGTWHITEVDLVDSGDGYVVYQPTGGGDRPWSSAWPSTFTVAAIPDRTAPTVTSFVLSKPSVNTATSAQKVHITAVVDDAGSGVTGHVGVMGFVAFGSKGYSAEAELKRVAGGSHHGTYSGFMTIPTWVGAGTHRWRLSLDVTDRADNERDLQWWALAQRHLTSSLLVVSKTDAAKPSLTQLSFTPSSVDARTGDRTVKVTLKGSDVGSGLANGWVNFTSPSGYEVSTGGYEGEGRALVVGHTLTADAVLPQCSEPGTWRISAGVMDIAGNFRVYTNAQLKALGLPTTLVVKSLDVQPPTGHVPNLTPHAGPIVVTFSEPVLFKGSINPLQVYDKTNYTTLAGTWACANTAGTAVGCNDDGADVKKATFTPTTALVIGRTYFVQASHGVYDTSGNGPGLIHSQFHGS